MNSNWYQALEPNSYRLTEDKDGFGISSYTPGGTPPRWNAQIAKYQNIKHYHYTTQQPSNASNCNPNTALNLFYIIGSL